MTSSGTLVADRVGIGSTVGLYVAERPTATTPHEIPFAKLVIPLDGADVHVTSTREGARAQRRRPGPIWIAPHIQHALALAGPSLTVLLDPRYVPRSVDETLGHSAVTGVEPLVGNALGAVAREVLADATSGLTDIVEEVRSLFSDIRRPSLDRRIDEVIQHLGGHPDASLDELARFVGLSRSHLSRRFRAVTGLTIRRHLQWQRLLAAFRRAVRGESLAEAAFGAGFSDQAHFTRVARARVGRSPGALMRNQVQALPAPFA